MIVELSITPLDHGMRMKTYIAPLLDIIDKSGLDYELTAMGTLLEGDSAEIWPLLQRCHDAAVRASSRVETRIVIDDRPGTRGRLAGMVRDIEEALGRKLKTAV